MGVLDPNCRVILKTRDAGSHRTPDSATAVRGAKRCCLYNLHIAQALPRSMTKYEGPDAMDRWREGASGASGQDRPTKARIARGFEHSNQVFEKHQRKGITIVLIKKQF
jgi:hypothetical protein